MSRHRGVRNRQFSYDEDDDYYDYDEESSEAYEEHRRHVNQVRAEEGTISLASYFDAPVVSHTQNHHGQRMHRDKHREIRGNGQESQREQRSAGKEDPGDTEIVNEIGAELERRLGQGRFTAKQIREAVVNSEFEIDTAEVLLSTMDVPSAQVTQGRLCDEDGAGLQTVSSMREQPFSPSPTPDINTPSSLAFGLRVNSAGSRTEPASIDPAVSETGINTRSNGARGTAASAVSFAPNVSSPTGDSTNIKPFGFDTPSPDDVNLSRQAAARNRRCSSTGPDAVAEPSVQHGRANAEASSPKAKVVHISTPTSRARKSIGGGSSRGSTPTASRTSTPTASRDVSPTPEAHSSNMSPSSIDHARDMLKGVALGDQRDCSGDEDPDVKEHLAMVVIGHVDAGKSTLMGQMLVQMGQVSQRALHKHEKEAREAGKASFFLAWVMDEDEQERVHGVTIDIAQKHIETETKLLTLLDAPGHRDFIPKMISGASAADAAMLVVPATAGEFESGFQANGQTKEHAMLAKALGVNQLLVVVNKLDAADPPWSEERYKAVKSEVGPFLAQLGFRPKKIQYVPASGLSAENVSKRDPGGALSKWYDGPTVLDAIDRLIPAPRVTDKPFRMCIADVLPGGKGVSVSGRVVQGRVQTGNKVFVRPLEDQASVARLERNGAPTQVARAGDSVEITLSGVDAARVLVGNVLCKAGAIVPAVQRFNAQIVALPALEVPIIKGTEFQLHMHNLDVVVHCSKLVSLTSGSGQVLKAKPRCVTPGATALIRITGSRPICLERYGDCRPLGRFVLRQRGVTVAVGLVLDTDVCRA